MILFAVLVILVLLCFAGVIFVGAPYLPTLSPQVEAAMELADLKSGQTLLELGCGDGKVLIAAAEKGARVIGYELNPLLALLAWLRTRRYGKRVSVVCGNFWTSDWPEAQVIFTFLLPKYMNKLDTKIVQSFEHPVKLVSFAFTIPDKEPTAQKNGVYRYDY